MKLNKLFKNPGGKPRESIEYRIQKYPMTIEKVAKLYKAGWTDEQVANFLNISVQILMEWKKDKKYALNRRGWKEIADDKVEQAMYKLATGYKHKITKVFCTDSRGIQTKQVIEKFAPNPTAGKYWLNNRKPDKWKEKIQTLNLTGTPDDVEFSKEFFGAKSDDKSRAKT